jgi:hypothetical protein
VCRSDGGAVWKDDLNGRNGRFAIGVWRVEVDIVAGATGVNNTLGK